MLDGKKTVATAMKIDAEPKADPKLIHKLINDEVKKATATIRQEVNKLHRSAAPPQPANKEKTGKNAKNSGRRAPSSSRASSTNKQGKGPSNNDASDKNKTKSVNPPNPLIPRMHDATLHQLPKATLAPENQTQQAWWTEATTIEKRQIAQKTINIEINAKRQLEMKYGYVVDHSKSVNTNHIRPSVPFSALGSTSAFDHQPTPITSHQSSTVNRLKTDLYWRIYLTGPSGISNQTDSYEPKLSFKSKFVPNELHIKHKVKQ